MRRAVVGNSPSTPAMTDAGGTTVMLRDHLGGDGGARLVGVDQPPQTIFLEVTAWSLNAASGLETTCFHRVEARRGDQSLCSTASDSWIWPASRAEQADDRRHPGRAGEARLRIPRN